MNTIKSDKALPPFLIDPKYRIWRHLLLILTVAIISFNQVFIAYHDCQSALGARIYLICIPTFLLYLFAMEFNYYYLLPRFLLKGKYIVYLMILSLIVSLLLALSFVGEYGVRNYLGLPHRISSYTNPLILVDSLASFILNLICFFGVTIIAIFRKWNEDNERISRLEYAQLRFERNKLKGQIAPHFLSQILHNTSALAQTNPAKANEMLMLLGRLLRYQLYDCNREKVLLSSDINNLYNFLNLAKLNKDQFDYDIHEEGDFTHIFLPPLLFNPLIQSAVNDSRSVKMLFCMKDKTLFFQCKSDQKQHVVGDEFEVIRERLELLFPNNHLLSVGNGVIELQIKLSA